jgi:hypothetical protein
VGKTLTAEGIAETLKTPLYAVSAGELGMDQRNIEHELQRIMDIAHSWGAVLLLDEADVFLEKRQVQDVGRNAMVSIFLRLLEYFQGILFLTTNRVETFDEAFQSRIHLALKYEELGQKARKDVWKQFLKMVKVMEGKETLDFTEREYEMLARHNLNGRQVSIISLSLLIEFFLLMLRTDQECSPHSASFGRQREAEADTGSHPTCACSSGEFRARHEGLDFGCDEAICLRAVYLLSPPSICTVRHRFWHPFWAWNIRMDLRLDARCADTRVSFRHVLGQTQSLIEG